MRDAYDPMTVCLLSNTNTYNVCFFKIQLRIWFSWNAILVPSLKQIILLCLSGDSLSYHSWPRIIFNDINDFVFLRLILLVKLRWRSHLYIRGLNSKHPVIYRQTCFTSRSAYLGEILLSPKFRHWLSVDRRSGSDTSQFIEYAIGRGCWLA